MRDIDCSVKSLSNPYVCSAPAKKCPLVGLELGA